MAGGEGASAGLSFVHLFAGELVGEFVAKLGGAAFALGGGEVKPDVGFHAVLLHADGLEVTHAELVLRWGTTLLGGDAKQLQRVRIALWNVFAARPGQSYTVLATTNIQPSAWSVLQSGVVPFGPFGFSDLEATNLTQRFYRLMTNPQ